MPKISEGLSMSYGTFSWRHANTHDVIHEIYKNIFVTQNKIWDSAQAKSRLGCVGIEIFSKEQPSFLNWIREGRLTG